MNDVTKPGATQQSQLDTSSADERQEAPARSERRAQALVPPVDIVERDDAVHITADMPGVSREALTIEVDDGVLSLEGELRLAMPEGLSATSAEVRAQRFARRFTLSNEIDAEAIEARLDNGVLHLTLPKKETRRPRRIEIKSA